MEIKVLAKSVLSGRIGEKTDWIVLTGPPGSGKTAVLSALGRLGHRTSSDVSRAYLESRVEAGESKFEARKDARALQETILLKMLVTEGSLPSKQRVFLEYALPDNIAFWGVEKLEPTSDVWRAAVRFRYRHVFILEALPIREDFIRTEDAAYQAQIATQLADVYGALGYEFSVVPALSPEDRVSIILERLATVGGVS